MDVVAYAFIALVVGVALGALIRWEIVLAEDEQRHHAIDGDLDRSDWIRAIERRRKLRREFEGRNGGDAA